MNPSSRITLANATTNIAKYRNFWGNLVIDLSQSPHEMIVQNLLLFDLPNIQIHSFKEQIQSGQTQRQARPPGIQQGYQSIHQRIGAGFSSE